jgi:putative hydrolase of the HAD superfamily
VTLSALLFDLDDTLAPEWSPILAGWEAVARRVWGESSAARVVELRAAAGALWEDEAPAAYCASVHLDLGEGLYGELGGSGPDADVARAASELLYRRAFDDALPPAWRLRSPELVELWRRTRIEALGVYPETLEVLERWSAARVPLALVTNGASALQRRKVGATGLERFFSAIVVSEEVGVGKPDPTMFATALDELGIDPGGAVMVGNDLDRDVAGSIAAGVRPVWIRRPGADDDDLPAPVGVDVITDLRELEALLG